MGDRCGKLPQRRQFACSCQIGTGLLQPFFRHAAFLDLAATIAIGVVVASFVLAAVLILRGPSLPDRVLGVDLIGLMSISFIAIVAVVTEEAVLLDAALALALVSFLGTVAFSRFIEQRGRGGS